MRSKVMFGYSMNEVIRRLPFFRIFLHLFEPRCQKIDRITQKLYEPYIREVPLFKGCSLAFIKQIVIKMQEEFFLPGEVIIEQGNIADQLYIVCHGKFENVGRNEDETEESLLASSKTYCSWNEISLLCNIPVPYTVRVCELSRLLRLDKQSLMCILEIYFSDDQIIIDNLLEGKQTYIRNKILESDLMLNIGRHESELALRLNSAAYNGDLYRMRRLVEAGVDADKSDYDGRFPLHIASAKGHENIVQFLLQKGSRVTVRDNYGNTPLFEAIKNGHDQVASLLVNAGALLTVENAGNCLCTAVANGDVDFIRRILSCGINPNSRNYDLRTPLHIAASESLYLIANIILDAGGSVLSKDRWGNTPLDEARVGGSKNLVKLLEDASIVQLSEFSEFSTRKNV